MRAFIVFGTLFVLMLSGLLFRACCVTFVDNYEVAYRYEKVSGKLSLPGRTGYILHWPIVTEVHTIDTRPMQVCLNANTRVLNCKLVQFNPEGLETFIGWHGRNDYDNDPTSAGPSQFNGIMMSYAFENTGKCTTREPEYPFLRVLRDLKPEELGASSASVPPTGAPQ